MKEWAYSMVLAVIVGWVMLGCLEADQTASLACDNASCPDGYEVEVYYGTESSCSAKFSSSDNAEREEISGSCKKSGSCTYYCKAVESPCEGEDCPGD